jgi:hypothetical protein
MCCRTFSWDMGWVKLMVAIKTTEINPEQTDNSKTAASGARRRNIKIVNMALVKAKPIADLKRLRVITVHSAESAIKNKITISTFNTSIPILPFL